MILSEELKVIDRESKSFQMKLDNAKKAGLKDQAFLAYMSGRVKLCRAKQLAESGYMVRNSSVFFPAGKSKVTKEND